MLPLLAKVVVEVACARIAKQVYIANSAFKMSQAKNNRQLYDNPGPMVRLVPHGSIEDMIEYLVLPTLIATGLKPKTGLKVLDDSKIYAFLLRKAGQEIGPHALAPYGAKTLARAIRRKLKPYIEQYDDFNQVLAAYKKDRKSARSKKVPDNVTYLFGDAPDSKNHKAYVEELTADVESLSALVNYRSNMAVEIRNSAINVQLRSPEKFTSYEALRDLFSGNYAPREEPKKQTYRGAA